MKNFFYSIFLSFFGIFVDIWNFYQTKQMFKFIKEDYKDLWDSLDLEISPIGVMYGFVEYQAGLSDRHYRDMINSRYDKLSECTVVLGLSGIVRFEYEKYDEDDEKIVFLVKYVPQPQYLSWWILINLIGGVLNKIIGFVL